jgi:hypothetical protein
MGFWFFCQLVTMMGERIKSAIELFNNHDENKWYFNLFLLGIFKNSKFINA